MGPHPSGQHHLPPTPRSHRPRWPPERRKYPSQRAPTRDVRRNDGEERVRGQCRAVLTLKYLKRCDTDSGYGDGVLCCALRVCHLTVCASLCLCVCLCVCVCVRLFVCLCCPQSLPYMLASHSHLNDCWLASQVPPPRKLLYTHNEFIKVLLSRAHTKILRHFTRAITCFQKQCPVATARNSSKSLR